jgi:ribosomal protein S18 acetylase RimI-like enzyme
VLAAAFATTPGFRYALPAEARRLHDLEWLLSRVLRAARWRGAAVDVLGEGPLAVAIWLEVADTYAERLLDLIRAGLLLTPLALGLTATRRLSRLGAVNAALHRKYAPRPHLYLQMIAVALEGQGRGVGSRLLAHGLARADASGRAVYLETDVPRNLALYQRHGFEVVGQSTELLDTPVWALVRGARR